MVDLRPPQEDGCEFVAWHPNASGELLVRELRRGRDERQAFAKESTLIRSELFEGGFAHSLGTPRAPMTDAQPNGSRLSCGRNARGRKAVEWQTKRLVGEATQ